MSENAVARRRLILLAPLAVLAAAGFGFFTMLNRMQKGRFDPHDIGNPMLGKPMPDFDLPGVGGAGFSSADLRKAAAAGPIVVNFFASWCIPCANEAASLANLAKSGVPIWGIAYKDKPPAVQNFLTQGGNPFARLAMDAGRVAIDFGLFGVPETFIIDRHGMIAWHHAGPLDDTSITNELLPKLALL